MKSKILRIKRLQMTPRGKFVSCAILFVSRFCLGITNASKNEYGFISLLQKYGENEDTIANIGLEKNVTISSLKSGSVKYATDGVKCEPDESARGKVVESVEMDKPWLKIDLEDVVKVGSVKVYNRLDEWHRKDDTAPFEIRVGNDENAFENPTCGCGDYEIDKMALVHCQGLSGRFVFLTQSRRGIINVCELEVFPFAEPTRRHAWHDLAVNQLTCSSSHWTWNGKQAPSVATDADDETMFHSSSADTVHWLYVDLGLVYDVGQVFLKVRYRDRANPFQIRVGHHLDWEKNSVCGCGDSNVPWGASSTTVECYGTEGRYVFVVLPKKENGESRILEVKTLKAFRHVEPPNPNKNLALHQKACMSSIYESSSGPELGVDGDLSDQSLVHSDIYEETAWFYVDLKTSYPIGKVKIFNRNDRRNRINPFKVLVGDSKTWKDNLPCGCGKIRMETELTISCGGFRGRYVFLVIERKKRAILNFRELEVYEHDPKNGPATKIETDIAGFHKSYACLIDGFNDETYEGVSEAECAQKCNDYKDIVETQGCLSFDYDQTARTCYVSTRSLDTIPTDHLLYKSGFVHYNKISAAGMCDVTEGNRLNCHARDERECRWKGCCWDQRGTDSCYHAKNSVEVKGTSCDEDCVSVFESFSSTGIPGMLETYYPIALKEAEYLKDDTSAEFWHFIESNEALRKSLLSTSWPILPGAIKNMYALYRKFDKDVISKYPMLFVGMAYQRRKMDVRSHPLFYQTGFYGYLAQDLNSVMEREYGSSGLTEGQRKLLIEEEDEKASVANEKQKEEDELVNESFKKSSNHEMLHEINSWEKSHESKLEREKYNDMVTKLTKECEVENVGDLKFPPRGVGTNGIEAIEYYLSRNESFMMFPTKSAPWPLLVDLFFDIPMKECDWVWRRILDGTGIITYARYSEDRFTKEFICKASDWNPHSLIRIVEDGGICGQLSHLARYNYICAGNPSSQVAQPAHLAGQRYVVEYNGKTNITLSGLTCQSWDSQTPHKHSKSHFPGNFCRKEKKDKAPWCYTTSRTKEWEYCFQPDDWLARLQRLDAKDLQFSNKFFQSITSKFHSGNQGFYEHDKWNFPPFGVDSRPVYSDYDMGLALSVSHSLDTWQSGQIALNLFHRLPAAIRQRFDARKLLYDAIEQNPFMVHLLFRLGDELADEAPYKQTVHTGVTEKLPSVCPTISADEEKRILQLKSIVRTWPDHDMPVAFEEFVVRVYANPRCCGERVGGNDRSSDVLAKIDAEIQFLKDRIDFEKQKCREEGEGIRRLKVARLACESISAARASAESALDLAKKFPEAMKSTFDCGDEMTLADYVHLLQLFVNEIKGTVSDEDQLEAVDAVCRSLPSVKVSDTIWAVTRELTACWKILESLEACGAECKAQMKQEENDLSKISNGNNMDGFWKPLYESGKCIGHCGEVIEGKLVWDASSQLFVRV